VPDAAPGLAALVRVAARVVAGVDGRAVIGLGGGVAVGKSRIASDLAAARRGTSVVSTDGFLLPNAELARLGLGARKGFPETYDDGAIRAFLAAVRGPGEPPTAPIYSHEAYDVVPDRRESLAGTEVVIFEGVHALRHGDLLDLAVYVDASEQDMEDWYAERLLVLTREPPPGTFYAGFVGLTPEEIDALARDVWRAVNLPNLREHILPTRERADVVVEKRADHSIVAVRGPAVEQ
jgi:type I pantothenate kinase